MKEVCLFINIIITSGCALSDKTSRPVVQNPVSQETVVSDSSLTSEHEKFLGYMRAELQITEELTQSCRLAAEGKKVKALETLKRIDWRKSEVKVSKPGIDYDGIIDFFLRRTDFSKDSCRDYASVLYRDSV
ncbi:hypothetical protein J2125_003977 [Erwinia toletana]|uniref:Lipoprotein n=1 Tax=Winslowiella toletana TaxID=92490 RepID=A0ABS4PFB1_9GAMM|nr:hypothetical protein [Winslowiella toletana]MBP2170785.1 hypothetical protein [Winslowiella toletana]